MIVRSRSLGNLKLIESANTGLSSCIECKAEEKTPLCSELNSISNIRSKGCGIFYHWISHIPEKKHPRRTLKI